MIAPGTRFRVARLPLARIVCTMVERRYPGRVRRYAKMLTERPDEDVLINVQPLPGGYYGVLDGHHRFIASLLSGRADVLALVVTEPGQPGYAEATDDGNGEMVA